MMSRTVAMSLYALCFVMACSVASAQDANHGWRPRDPPWYPPVGSLSTFNTATQQYEPVTSDSRYTYYRIKVSLVNKFEDFFYPVPGKPTLISAVISGDVIDNTTSIKTLIASLAVELGPNGDDTLFISSTIQRAHLNQEVTDFDLAITGGTGRYKGATGELMHAGTSDTKSWNAYTAEVAVPKFKRF